MDENTRLTVLLFKSPQILYAVSINSPVINTNGNFITSSNEKRIKMLLEVSSAFQWSTFSSYVQLSSFHEGKDKWAIINVYKTAKYGFPEGRI